MLRLRLTRAKLSMSSDQKFATVPIESNKQMQRIGSFAVLHQKISSSFFKQVKNFERRRMNCGAMDNRLVKIFFRFGVDIRAGRNELLDDFEIAAHRSVMQSAAPMSE